MKKVVITQSNYIPWKGYFDNIAAVDELVLYDDVQYTRRDWRNRNQIKTPQGLLWLTVPVEVSGKYLQKIKETRISDSKWAEKHWKSIQANYAKAACYAQTADFLADLYRQASSPWLSEVNHLFMSAICRYLGIGTPIRWSGEFALAEGKTERLVEICRQLGATDYYSGPAAKAYMDESLFEAAGINVHYFDYSGYPEYRQLHGDFTHGLSIVDLLLNEGQEAHKYLKHTAKP